MCGEDKVWVSTVQTKKKENRRNVRSQSTWSG